MPTSKSADRQSGFSLFECLVVLAIVSLMAGLTALGVRTYSPKRMLGAAQDQIIHDLRRAQAAAQLEDRPITILWTDDGYAGSVWGEARALPRGVRLIAEPAVMRVYPEGHADALTIRLYAKDQMRAVSVNGFSGKVSAHDPAS